MKKLSKFLLSFTTFSVLAVNVFALPFNQKLEDSELKSLNDGQIVIRNINYYKNVCLNTNNTLANEILQQIDDLNPKYLAEIIQIKPIKGNEDLPDKLEELLMNVPEYAGIPYYSERHETWYDLYSSASILNITEEGTTKNVRADLEMSPFGTVQEQIVLKNDGQSISYSSKNLNKLSYHDQFDCVWPEKLKLCIVVFKDGENWIIYGIGGVNAPRIPFFTERIETSFINRIKTFCNFIFTKI